MVDNAAMDATTRGPLIIGGNFIEWGSKHTNFRGRRLLKTLAPLDLGIADNDVALTLISLSPAPPF